MLARRGPSGVVPQRARRFHLARGGDELRQRGAGVGNDAQVGTEHPPDLRRLDVHVHELAAFRVHIHRPGVAVGPAIADTEHEIAFQERRIAVAVAGLQADHARHQRVVVRDRAPTHERWNHRHTGDLGELHQQVGGVRVDDAAAGHDQRALGLVQHGQRPLRLSPRGGRLVRGQTLIELFVEFDFRHLHVDREVHQYRAGPAGAHEVECVLEHAGHQRGFAHAHGPLGDRLRNSLDVDGLKVFFVELGAGCLPSDAQEGDAVRLGGVETGDHVGAGGAGGADAHADVAGFGTGVTLGHVRCAFDVPRQDVPNRPARLQSGVEGVYGGAGYAEGDRHALSLQHAYRGLDRPHFGHVVSPLLVFCLCFVCSATCCWAGHHPPSTVFEAVPQGADPVDRHLDRIARFPHRAHA